LKGEYSIGKNEAWSVDIFGNVYPTNKKVIQKYDSVGVLKFTQSIKSFGKVQGIKPINTMKLVLFSEEQQILCYMDNTLTLSEECIDLTKFDIGMASHIAASGQPEKLWVIDQLNSKLFLLDLSGRNQSQEIKNLKGILNMSDIRSMIEVNNELFILDSSGVIYRFDLYGSLINTYSFKDVKEFTVREDALVVFSEESLIISHLSDDDRMIFSLPRTGINDFGISGNFFYFRVENKILKFALTFRQ
jgi:hypothetical protein